MEIDICLWGHSPGPVLHTDPNSLTVRVLVSLPLGQLLRKKQIVVSYRGGHVAL